MTAYLDADDRTAIRRLVDHYALYADRGDVDRFGALFAPDARLVVVEPDGTEGRPLLGRDAIAVIPSRLARYDLTLHLVSTHDCEPTEPGRSTGTAYCEAHHHRDGVDSVMFIAYADQYQRTPDGWRFATREVHVRWREARPLTAEP